MTPDDVRTVKFGRPPFGKRGYDEEEVDAFLDIVEVELSRLIEENNDLKARGGSSDNAPNGQAPQVVHSGVNPADLEAARADNGRLQSRINELESALNQGNEGAAQQLVGNLTRPYPLATLTDVDCLFLTPHRPCETEYRSMAGRIAWRSALASAVLISF